MKNISLAKFLNDGKKADTLVLKRGEVYAMISAFTQLGVLLKDVKEIPDNMVELAQRIYVDALSPEKEKLEEKMYEEECDCPACIGMRRYGDAKNQLDRADEKRESQPKEEEKKNDIDTKDVEIFKNAFKEELEVRGMKIKDLGMGMWSVDAEEGREEETKGIIEDAAVAAKKRVQIRKNN